MKSLLFVTLLFSYSLVSHTQNTVFINVNIIPAMEEQRVLINQAVIIEDGKIKEIAPMSEMKLSPERQTIDCHGIKYLVPCFNDNYTYLAFAKRIEEKDRCGRIAVGEKANMILLHGSPLNDIENSRKISGVVLEGDYLSKIQNHQNLRNTNQDLIKI